MLLRSGWDEFAYIVKEVYFDGTYKVIGYDTKNKIESGEIRVISHYLEVIQNTDSQAA